MQSNADLCVKLMVTKPAFQLKPHIQSAPQSHQRNTYTQTNKKFRKIDKIIKVGKTHTDSPPTTHSFKKLLWQYHNKKHNKPGLALAKTKCMVREQAIQMCSQLNLTTGVGAFFLRA